MLLRMIPNIISISRILLMPIIVFLIGKKSILSFLAAAIIFSFAALTDLWDGLIARHLGVSSKFGAFIDPLADKFLTLGVLAGFVHNNILPLSLFLIFAMRDIFMTVLRSIVGKANLEWKTSQLAKWKTFLQLIVLYGGFGVIGAEVKFFTIPVILIQNLFLLMSWIIALITLYSALDYLIKYQNTLEKIIFTSYKWIHNRNMSLVISTLGFAWIKLPAPGTTASVIALFLAWLLPLNNSLAGLAITILGIIGWAYASQAIIFLKKEDPSIIVIDEIVAMLLVFFWLQPPTWAGYILGFLFFRLFDILKIFPINKIEQKIKGGLGIMLDDLAAAAMAITTTKIVLIWLENY